MNQDKESFWDGDDNASHDKTLIRNDNVDNNLDHMRVNRVSHDPLSNISELLPKFTWR